MARLAPEKSNFFMRCNYQIDAPRGPAVTQEQLVKAEGQIRSLKEENKTLEEELVKDEIVKYGVKIQNN